MTTKEENKQNENGRSMVEMLGTLAIMGVLSIGGIAGYSYAIDKYRANEVLNEVRKRAVVASQQMMVGRTTIDFSEFAAQISDKYSVATEVNGNKFNIAVSGLEKNVCQEIHHRGMIIGQIDDTVACADGDNNTVTFMFDKLLGELDGNGNDKDYSKKLECINGGKLSTDGYKCDCPDNFGGIDCSVNKTECDKNGGIYGWSNIEDCHCPLGFVGINCEKELSGNTCTSNEQCTEPGTYCNMTGEWTGNSSSCYNNFRGTCDKIISSFKVPGTSYIRSTRNMTWWSANNWCEAQGKSLVSISSFGITGGYESGSCSGTDCTDADWGSIRQKFGSGWYWTREAYGSGGDNSCGAWYVFVNYANVDNGTRVNNDHISPLCGPAF